MQWRYGECERNDKVSHLCTWFGYFRPTNTTIAKG